MKYSVDLSRLAASAAFGLACCAVSAQQLPPCGVDVSELLLNVPGYNNEPGARQPGFFKPLQACLQQRAICLVAGNNVIAGDTPKQVAVNVKSVRYAFVKVSTPAGDHVCAHASLLNEIGGDQFWAYRQYSDGRRLRDGPDEDPGSPKTSIQVLTAIEKTFGGSFSPFLQAGAARPKQP